MTRITQAGSSKLMPGEQTPAETERLLRYDDVQNTLAPEAHAYLLAEVTQLKRRLEQITCSFAWFNHCWRFGGNFPPRADTTPMAACQCERCLRVGKLWPCHYAAPLGTSKAFVSYECYLEGLSDWEAAHLPSSPSGMALRAIREGRIKLRRQRTHTAGRRFRS